MADDVNFGSAFKGFGPTYPIGENGNIPQGLPSGAPPPKDSIQSGSGDVSLGQIFSRDLSDGRITIAQFAELVQTALDKSKEATNEVAQQDANVNKIFQQAILAEFALLKEIHDAIFALGKQAESLYQEGSPSVFNMNSDISAIYAGQQADKNAILAYNQAFTNFNNPSSPDYHNQNKLSQAVSDYNNYVDARKSEIANFDSKVDSYNTKADVVDQGINTINQGLSKFSFAIGGQKLEGLGHASHYQGAFLGRAAGSGLLSDISLTNGNSVSSPPPFNMEEFMKTYWGPVQNYFLGQMLDLIKTINFHTSIDAFQGMMGRLQGFRPQNLLMLNLMTTIMGNGDSKGQALGLPFQASFANRLAAKAIMAAIAETAGVLIPQTVQMEVQHAILSTLSKASLFAGSSPSLQFLGESFGRLNLSDNAYNSAMSFAFAGRIGALVEGGTLRASIEDAIARDPSLGAMSPEDKAHLSNQIVSAVNLSLLNAAVMNMAITLKVPGLGVEVMGNALSAAGIDTPLGTTLMSALTDRSSTLQAEGEVAASLVNSGFSPEFAGKAVGNAVTDALNCGPYATVNDFINSLSMNFQSQGLGMGMARSSAIDFTASVLGNNPTAALNGNDLDTAVTLGVISKDVFLSTAVKNAVGGGAAYERAILSLLNDVDPKNVLSVFASGVGSAGVRDALPAVTLREVRSALHANLVKEGLDVNAAWDVANKFTDLVKNGEPFAMAIQVNPFNLGFMQSELAKVFSKSTAGAIMAAALSSPASLQSQDFVKTVVSAFETVGSYRVGVLQLGLIAQGVGADVAGKIALDVSNKNITLRDAISRELGVSPAKALEIAGLVNAGIDSKSALEKILISRGIDPDVASKIAIAIGADFGVQEAALKNAISSLIPLDPARADAIASSIDVSSVINLSSTASAFGAALQNLELATTLIGNALRVQGALDSDIAFKRALIDTTALTMNIDVNQARDLVANIQVDIIRRDALVNQLTEAFLKNGLSREMAITVSASILPSSTQSQAFQNALGNHIMATIGVPANVAASIAREVELKNILIIDTLQSEISSALDREGADDIAKDLSQLIVQDPKAFESEQSFIDSVTNHLFIDMDFDIGDARQVASSLVLDGIFNRELLQNKITEAFEKAGYSPIQSDVNATKAAQTFFLINTPKLDLPVSAKIAQAIALSGAFGFKELTNTISNILLDRGIEDDPTIRQNFAEQIAAEVIVNPASFTGVDGFRHVLKEKLLAVIGTLDQAQATEIANKIPVTEALRLDIFIQAIINAGVKNGFF